MLFKSDKQSKRRSYSNTSLPQPVTQNPGASQSTLELQQPAMQHQYASQSTLSFHQPFAPDQYAWQSTYQLQQQNYYPQASNPALAYGLVGDLTKPPQQQGYSPPIPIVGPVYAAQITSPPLPHYSSSPIPEHGYEQAMHTPAPPQQQSYSPPVPPKIRAPDHAGRSTSLPQHPIYGAIPQEISQHHHSYTYPAPKPYVANPSLSVISPPANESKNRLGSSLHKANRLASKSCVDLRGQLTSGAEKSMTILKTTTIDKPQAIISKSTQVLNQGAALCDLMSAKLDTVITNIDGDHFGKRVPDLNGFTTSKRRASSGNESSSSSSDDRGSNHFSKVWLYANSRLPPHLPPFKVYIPTFPLLCLAANYSESVYTPPAPRTSEVDTHIPADWRSGTKAMVLKAIPVDDMNTIVFAIRGTQTFMDWAVNYKTSPASPRGFLDDEGNLCHAGFLDVAKKMVKPVADRLKTLLEENPSRSNCSLLITGHSAGGAVASLLYAHMMSEIVSSDLSYLTGFFKRVHCVTFGAPPVSLLPLKRSEDKRHRKSLFFSFINEGDPVPRADKQVILSLVKLYVSAAPTAVYNNTLASMTNLKLTSTNTSSSLDTTTSSKSNKSKKPKKVKEPKSLLTAALPFSKIVAPPTWAIPACTMCVAGRLVILRQKPDGRGEEDVEAVTVEEEILRDVVYGDPEKHMMTLYQARIERLAVRAVTAGDF